MNFKAMKLNRSENLKKLQEETKKLTNNGYENDPDDWYPSVDKAGNGYALIRFLPRINDDDVEFARWYSHNFQDEKTKKWYIENCRSTLNLPDPVMEFNKKLWDSVEESPKAKFHENRKQATRQGRKVNYRANIYVIEDGVDKENNGKVKKFKFAKWAFDKIDGIMFNKFGKKNINPFDLWDGANFRIEITSEVKDGRKQRNYTNSTFERPEPLASDEEMEKIFEQIQGWSVKSYVDPSNFKEYDVLKKKLDEVVGFDTSLWTPDGIKTKELRQPENKSSKLNTHKKIEDEEIGEKTETKFPKSSTHKKIEDEEDNMESDEFFKSLKNEDDDIPF